MVTYSGATKKPYKDPYYSDKTSRAGSTPSNNAAPAQTTDGSDRRERLKTLVAQGYTPAQAVNVVSSEETGTRLKGGVGSPGYVNNPRTGAVDEWRGMELDRTGRSQVIREGRDYVNTPQGGVSTATPENYPGYAPKEPYRSLEKDNYTTSYAVQDKKRWYQTSPSLTTYTKTVTTTPESQAPASFTRQITGTPAPAYSDLQYGNSLRTTTVTADYQPGKSRLTAAEERANSFVTGAGDKWYGAVVPLALPAKALRETGGVIGGAGQQLVGLERSRAPIDMGRYTSFVSSNNNEALLWRVGAPKLSQSVGEAKSFGGEIVSLGRGVSAGNVLTYGGGLMRRAGDKPVTTTIDIGTFSATGSGGLLVNSGLRFAAGYRSIGAIGDVRGYNEPSTLKNLRGNAGFLAAVKEADNEVLANPLEIGFGYGLKRRAEAGIEYFTREDYARNLRTKLKARGFAGEELESATAAGVYEKGTRRAQFILPAVVAEMGGNAGGGWGVTKAREKFADKIATNPKLYGGIAYAVGVAPGGFVEGASVSAYKNVVDRERVSPGRALGWGGFGIATASSTGFVVGFAGGAKSRLVAEGTEQAANFLDAPNEWIGDAASNAFARRSGRVATFVPSPEQVFGAKTGAVVDIRSRTLSSSQQKIGFFSITSPSIGVSRSTVVADEAANPFAFSSTTTREAAFSRSLANTRTNIFSPSNVPVPIASPVPSTVPVNSLVNSFARTNVPVPVNTRVPVPVDTIVPTPDLPVMLPLFGGAGYDRRGRRGRGFQYAPSLTAIFSGITTTKQQSAFTTGFGIRPMLVAPRRRRKRRGKR